MSVALQKIEGVENVDVSLNEGSATIKLKSHNKVTVEQVREVIRKNGFTPKDTRVRVAGKLIERNGKPALEVSGLDQVLLLSGPREKFVGLDQRTGQAAILVGTIHEAINEPLMLTVEEVEH